MTSIISKDNVIGRYRNLMSLLKAGQEHLATYAIQRIAKETGLTEQQITQIIQENEE
ncbi:hypothetical protein [Undibacterium sp. WLHG33]|uniref:hypothetical protein n=1 Tax=Undibacterium sp. WLHG33 TaxID=3412482 RepID=UPI003C2C9206